MTKLYRCDRCNSVIEEVNVFNLYTVVVKDLVTGTQHRGWHLCRECEDNLDLWIKDFSHSGNNTHSKFQALSTSQGSNSPHAENSSGGEPEGKPAL